MAAFDKENYERFKEQIEGNPELKKLADEQNKKSDAVYKRISDLTSKMGAEGVSVPTIVYALMLDAVTAFMAFKFGDRAYVRDSLSTLLDELLDMIDKGMEDNSVHGLLSEVQRLAGQGKIDEARRLVREKTAEIKEKRGA